MNHLRRIQIDVMQTYDDHNDDIVNSFKFGDIVRILDLNIAGKKKLSLIFKEPTFFEKLRGQSAYGLVRLLAPDRDRERHSYGIKEAKMAGYIAEALGLSKDSFDAKRIVHYFDPQLNPRGRGILSDVVEDVLISRGAHSEFSNITIGQVNDFLNDLCDAKGNPAKTRALVKICNVSVGYREIKYIIRIVLNSLRVGFSAETVIGRLHSDALAQFNTHTDLRRVCADVRDRNRAFTSQIKFGDSFHCMLAEAANSMPDSISRFGDEDFYIEDKLDGERCLIHLDATDIEVASKVYSRNCTDLDKRYGYRTWILSPLKDAVVKGLSRAIFDGEVMGYNSETETFTALTEIRQIATASGSVKHGAYDVTSTNKWMCYVVFDVVYLEFGEWHGSVMHLPLRKRKEILKSILNPIPKRIELVNEIHCSGALTKKDKLATISEQLEKVILLKKEGIVLKNAASEYVLNARMSDKWVKLKPEYIEGLSDTFDVIILGGYYARGKAKSTTSINAYMVGVAQRPMDGAQPSAFYTLGIVSSFKAQELQQLDDMLLPYAKPYPQKGQSETLPHLAGNWRPVKTDDRPDFYYPPENSVILEVSATEIIPTKTWATQLTFRFPKVLRIRHDKSWYMCDSLEQVKRCATGGTRRIGGKLATSKKRVTSNRRFQAAVPECYKKFKIAVPDTQASDLLGKGQFSGLSIYVVRFTDPDSDPDSSHLANSKVFSEFLQSHGASVLHICTKTALILGHPDRLGPEFRQLCKSDNQDVFSLFWILRCLEMNEYIPPKFSDFLWVCKHMVTEAKGTNKNFDMFRDHYVEHATSHNLEQSMMMMTNIEADVLTSQAIQQGLDDETEEFSSLCDWLYLQDLNLYFDEQEMLNNSVIRQDFKRSILESTKIVAKMYGATIFDTMDLERVTYIVIDAQSAKERVPKLKEEISALEIEQRTPTTAEIIDCDWLLRFIHTKTSWIPASEAEVYD